MESNFPATLAGLETITDVKLFFRAEMAALDYSHSACGAFLPTDKGPEPYF